MKTIGKKSLSSVVYHLLWVLLPLGVLALLASSVWVGLELHDLFLEQTVVVFPVLAIVGLAWLSGICCCLLLWQLIGIFRRLREGNCFTPDNVPPLTRSAWCLWGIGVCFLGVCVALFCGAGMQVVFTFFLSLLGLRLFCCWAPGCGYSVNCTAGLWSTSWKTI